MQKFTFTQKSSKDYAMFKKLEGNRPVNPNQVQKIIESVKAINVLKAKPIIVANGYIIDGQHRFEACVQLEEEVNYIEVSPITDEEMRFLMSQLNSNVKNWSPADYLQQFVIQGKENYIYLKDFLIKDGDKKNKISISTAVYFLSNFNDLAYKNLDIVHFKEGFYMPENKEKGEQKRNEFLRIRELVLEHAPTLKKAIESANFIKAFTRLSEGQENFNFPLFYLNLSADLRKVHYHRIFNVSDSLSTYYDMMVAIHNLDAKKEHRLKRYDEVYFDKNKTEQDTEVDDLPF